MTNILIVYATDHHATERMAQSATKGAESVPDTTAVLKPADNVVGEDFTAADGVLFGSPVHMGSMDPRMKLMIDRVCGPLWMKSALVGKVSGVFASGGGIGGGGAGAELTMVSMLNNFAELGMIMVPLPLNTPGYADGALQWGPYGRAHDHDGKPVGLRDDQLTAVYHHGANVSRVAAALKGRTLFAAPAPAAR